MGSSMILHRLSLLLCVITVSKTLLWTSTRIPPPKNQQSSETLSLSSHNERIAAAPPDASSFQHPGFSLDLVVNQCNESISWLVDWTKQLRVHRVYIYSKCGRTNTAVNATATATTDADGVNFHEQDNFETIPLPNVGREGHSWLTHMLRQQQQQRSEEDGRTRTDGIHVADWTVFLQGHHECSLGDVMEGLTTLLQTNANVSNSNSNGILLPSSAGQQPQGYNFLDLSQYAYLRDRTLPNCYQYGRCNPHGLKRRTMCRWHEHYRRKQHHNRTCDNPRMTLRGEFIVAGELLRQQNWTLLEELKEWLENDAKLDQLGRAGHMLERLWAEVLDTNDLDLLGSQRWEIERQQREEGKGGDGDKRKRNSVRGKTVWGASRENGR